MLLYTIIPPDIIFQKQDEKCEGKIIDIYYYSDTYVKIPEINEKVEYMKGE